MRLVSAAALYFVLVFGAGFALGAIRVPLLVPRLGERVAELIELPIMVAVILLVSRRRQRRTAGLAPAQQLVVGVLAFGFMLVAEVALGVVLQGRSPIEVLGSHDPVSGTLYYAALLLFAVMPWWWARRENGRPPRGERKAVRSQ